MTSTGTMFKNFGIIARWLIEIIESHQDLVLWLVLGQYFQTLVL